MLEDILFNDRYIVNNPKAEIFGITLKFQRKNWIRMNRKKILKLMQKI